VLQLYQKIREMGVEGEGCEWVSFDSEQLTATVQGKPSGSDISLPVDANTVVEFLSR
jgi:small subunit ribosomal protein S4